MAQRRRKQREETPEEDTIAIVGVKKSKDLRPARRNRRSKYDDMVDAASRLRPGEVLEVSCDAANLEKERNKISAVIRRKAQPLTEHTLKIKTTENKTIGIYCFKKRE